MILNLRTWQEISDQEIITAVKDGNIGTPVIAYRIARSRNWKTDNRKLYQLFNRDVYRAVKKAEKACLIERVNPQRSFGYVAFWSLSTGGAA